MNCDDISFFLPLLLQYPSYCTVHFSVFVVECVYEIVENIQTITYRHSNKERCILIAAKTLRRYIQRCDELLAKPTDNAIDQLVTEIVSVFRADIADLTFGLVSYEPYVEGSSSDYIEDITVLRAKLQKELDVLEPIPCKKETLQKRSKKIFISHATQDKNYVDAIITLLESLGFREDDIICSSIPPYCIPLGENVYNWLANEFQHSDLHVIFVLSQIYYTRPACLNEMGAAWATKHKWTAILLPGFGFDEIAGCIDPAQVSIKLDDADRNTLNFRLSELKDDLIAEFGLRSFSEAFWERKRNEFLERICREKSSLPDSLKESTITSTDEAFLGKDACILLVYAADDPGGQILVVSDLTRLGPSISTYGYEFAVKDTPRECARWKGALDELEIYQFIKAANAKRQVFTLTTKGYELADIEKNKLGIDTSRNPENFC